MDVTYLNVGLVQDLQRALMLNEPVASVVSGLRRASLPGILEYGCLRRAFGDTMVPRLPEAITSSPLGLALHEVPSELGIRATGVPKSTPRRTDHRQVEFHAIGDETDLLDQAWNEYLLRFEFSAKGIGFSPTVATGLQAALHEMAANSVTHAKATLPALVGYEVKADTALFCIVDTGIGVLESLRANPAHRHLTLHTAALRAALRDGISGVVGTERRGFGFHQVFKSLTSHWGNLRFRSREGCLQMDGTALDADRGEVSFPPDLPGFQVTVCCRTTPPKPRKFEK